MPRQAEPHPEQCFTPAETALLLAPQRWRVHCSQFPCPAGHRPDARRGQWMQRHSHSHAHIEVLFVLSGRDQFGWRERVYEVAPGGIVVIAPHEKHDMRYPGSRQFGGEHLWLLLLEDCFVIRRVLHGSGRQFHRVLWEFLMTPNEAGVSTDVLLPPAQTHETAALCRVRVCGALQVLLARVVAGAAGRVTPGPRTFQRDIVQAIQRHIRSTAGRGVSLDGLARVAGYSRYYFLRMFKRATGITPQQYVDQCRRERVRELLAQGMAKKTISEELGFSHATAFSRWLQRNEL